MKNSQALRTVPEIAEKRALRRRRLQKLQRRARKITRQHGQTARPATR